MSETDDTDVLLLIPPNFFLVNSSGSEDSPLESSRTVVHKPRSCTAQVLGKLVDQVHTLESRLSSLEINSTTETLTSFCTLPRSNLCDTTDSFESRSFDSKYFTFPRRRRRKLSKKDRRRDTSLTSTEISVNEINIAPLLKLSNNLENSTIKNTYDSRSMDGDISSIISTPSKKNDKLLLNEIDEFLTKVEAYESPESKYKDQSTSSSPQNVIRAAGDYISQKLDSKNDEEVRLPSGRIVSSNVLDKYIYLVRSQPESVAQSDKSHLSNVNRNSYEVASTSVSQQENREPNVSNLDVKSPSIRRLNFSENVDVQPTSTPKRPVQTNASQIDSFRPSSNKIYDRANKVLEQYKIQNLSRTAHSSLADTNYLASSKDEFRMPQMRPYEHKESLKSIVTQNKMINTIDTDLLSLSDLWGEKGCKLDKGESLKLEEERLRREHCEAMIQQLQKKILDQQEKLAVALKVDRTKDVAISKLKEAWLKITGSLDKAEERHRAALEKMLREVDNFKLVADQAQKKTNHFEAELYKALDLAHDYQDKCKQIASEKKTLEDSMRKALADQGEIIVNKDKEIAMLKENYSTVMKLNKQSTDCVKNLEDALEKEKSDHDHTKGMLNELNHRIQSINEETSLLLQERDVLKDKVNEERARCNILDRQLCEKQGQTSDLLKKCDNLDSEVQSLRKHLELQRNELKVHYQRQLEDAVLAKLREFQEQLEQAQGDMDNDARAKENAIVDGFNKQIMRIEEQHKLEVNVLEEKQREEIKLYRLQLAQAGEKIGLLENKVESYRRRRVQIASQLHGVMESQWRQALLILTNHSSKEPAPSASSTLTQDFSPPPPRPDHKTQLPDKRDLNFDGLSDSELKHYVNMLLLKPPSTETGALRDAISIAEPEEPTSDRPKPAKKSLNHNKPPWKS